MFLADVDTAQDTESGERGAAAVAPVVMDRRAGASRFDGTAANSLFLVDSRFRGNDGGRGGSDGEGYGNGGHDTGRL